MVALTAQWIIAHQGGWDELLMFGVPIVLAVVAVRWAERRGKARQEAAEHDTPADQHEDAEH